MTTQPIGEPLQSDPSYPLFLMAERCFAAYEPSNKPADLWDAVRSVYLAGFKDGFAKAASYEFPQGMIAPVSPIGEKL